MFHSHAVGLSLRTPSFESKVEKIDGLEYGGSAQDMPGMCSDEKEGKAGKVARYLGT